MRIESLSSVSLKITRVLQSIEAAIGITCLFVMFAVMIINVVSRYLLYKPIAWSDELGNYLFIWMSFLASSYVMGNDGHVRVTAIESRLPEKARNIVHFVMNLIMFVMFSLYIIPSFKMLGKLKLSNMMRVPLSLIYVIMPLSFLLMCVHIANNMVQDVSRMKANSSKDQAADRGDSWEGKKCC